MQLACETRLFVLIHVCMAQQVHLGSQTAAFLQQMVCNKAPRCFLRVTGNVASLPDNHLAAGQSAMKLRDDLYAAKNSADLLSEMLAPISIHNPADVKQVRLLLLAKRQPAEGIQLQRPLAVPSLSEQHRI